MPSAPVTGPGPWPCSSEGADDLRWIRPDDAAALAEVTAELVAVGVAAGGRGVGRRRSRRPGRLRTGQGPGRHPAGSERHGRLDRSDRAAAWPAGSRGSIPIVPGMWGVRCWSRPTTVPTGCSTGTPGWRSRVTRGMEVALASGDALRRLAPSRLDRVETWWAMTIHKSQGSEFPHAVVALPDHRSPILTRELLYTGGDAGSGAADHRGRVRGAGAGHRPPLGPGLGSAGPAVAHRGHRGLTATGSVRARPWRGVPILPPPGPPPGPPPTLHGPCPVTRFLVEPRRDHDDHRRDRPSAQVHPRRERDAHGLVQHRAGPAVPSSSGPPPRDPRAGRTGRLRPAVPHGPHPPGGQHRTGSSTSPVASSTSTGSGGPPRSSGPTDWSGPSTPRRGSTTSTKGCRRPDRTSPTPPCPRRTTTPRPG